VVTNSPPQPNEKNMKTKNKLNLLAVAAAALALNITTGTAQTFDSVESLKNRAIAASPRAKEAFPWLAPERTAQSLVRPSDAKTASALADVQRNRAFAASPRVLEQFPELGRPALPLQKSVVASEATAALKNRAFAASPRVLEQFPELARGWTVRIREKSFEVAPLK
jgi:hypothetical protein